MLVPLGFTVPFKVAPATVTLDALLVVTVGGHVDVVNVISDPLVVPPLLVPTAR